jgi:hypothetical protein
VGLDAAEEAADNFHATEESAFVGFALAAEMACRPTLEMACLGEELWSPLL